MQFDHRSQESRIYLNYDNYHPLLIAVITGKKPWKTYRYSEIWALYVVFSHMVKQTQHHDKLECYVTEKKKWHLLARKLKIGSFG